MHAVGINVSKGKSTVAILRSHTDVAVAPFDVPHTMSGMNHLLATIHSISEDPVVFMEHTGRYYEPVAQTLCRHGIPVVAFNPLLFKGYGSNSLRNVKTDKADARKIARYGLDYFQELRQYTPMDTTRYELKTLNRQFQLASKNKVAFTNNLTSLLDASYPNICSHFNSPARKDGSQKWVDFSVNTLEKLCVAFERSPDELLGFTTSKEELAFRMAAQVVHYRIYPLFHGDFTTFPVCPNCSGSVEREHQHFCSNCGQKLFWDFYHYVTPPNKR